MIIGVTGVSGSGKSTVSKFICNLKNAKLVDADEIAKSMQSPRKGVLQNYCKSFWRRNFIK